MSTKSDQGRSKRKRNVKAVQSDDNTKWLFKPHPGKQEIFLSSTVDEVFYGGSRGGGKSHVLAGDAALKPRKYYIEEIDGREELVVEKVSIDYPEYRALLLRRSYRDIENNFKPICDRIYSGLGGVWVERKKAYVFPSGAQIHLGHCQTITDVNNYIGGNYHYIGFEEANQFPWKWVEMIYGSCRSTNPELKPFKRLTSNPGGVGHVWLKKRFVEKSPPVIGEIIHDENYNVDYADKQVGKTYVDDKGNTRLFIPATVFDNPSILENDPQYVKYLQSLDETMRKMWLYGDWDVAAGQFFSEWNEFHHVIPKEEFQLDLRKHRVFRAMDYGTNNPFVCMFVAVDTDGAVTVFDEIYRAGLSATPQAKLVAQRTRELGLTERDIYATVADPAYWIKNLEKEETRVSPARIYQENGVTKMVRGINDRVAGALLMRDYIRIPEEGVPPLRFTSNCTHAIETIPALVHSIKNVEDVDTDGDDHIYDALRYLIMHLGKAPRRIIPKKKMGWREKLKLNRDRRDEPDSCWVY